ncbi:class D sortase [Wenzhouxiangella sp. XN201]|nr:class D sortase [Wenzhouxiangella sp. XN201]
MAKGSGRMIVELACWVVGIALIVIYFLTTSGLETQRQQGIELFTQARAEAAETTVGHRLEDLPLPGQTAVSSVRQEAVPETAPAVDIASLPVAVLRIAKVGLEVPVYADLSELNLSRGAGWIGGTAAPNTGGNMAIAAHRDQYFRPLKDIQVGDTIELESLSGHGEYRVSRIAIVDPEDVTVLDDTTVPTVTLVTCYPFYFIGNAPQRYIVQATAVEKPGKAFSTDAAPTARNSGETP